MSLHHYWWGISCASELWWDAMQQREDEVNFKCSGLLFVFTSSCFFLSYQKTWKIRILWFIYIFSGSDLNILTTKVFSELYNTFRVSCKAAENAEPDSRVSLILIRQLKAVRSQSCPKRIWGESRHCFDLNVKRNFLQDTFWTANFCNRWSLGRMMQNNHTPSFIWQTDNVFPIFQ